MIACGRWSLGRIPGVLLCLVLLGASGIHAQEDDPRVETRLLRTAASAESSGDLAGAEEALRSLMNQRPTSTRGIFALERVLRAQGRIREILPFAERYTDVEPDASGPRLLELRVYAELADESGLEEAAEDWMGGGRFSSEPYREVARAFARAFGPERALSILERGRSDLGRPSLFAMEVGDLLRDLGRMEEAVLEWAEVIGNDGALVSAVMRRVAEIEEDRETLVLPLLDQLRQPPTTGARLRAGARIALEAGVLEQATALAETASQDLPDRLRRSFLTAFALQAQEVSAMGVALWAYEALREGAVDDAEARALDLRITVAALATGDTARAVEAQQAIADDLPEGSTERQRALAEIKGRLKSEPALVGQTIAEMEAVCQTPNRYDYEDYRTLSWDQVREMNHSELYRFGSHSVDHAILSQFSRPEKEHQIRASKETLEDELQEEIHDFSYPEGRSMDYDAETIELLEAAGFTSSPSAEFGVNTEHTSVYHLKRNMVGFTASFEACLDGA